MIVRDYEAVSDLHGALRRSRHSRFKVQPELAAPGWRRAAEDACRLVLSGNAWAWSFVVPIIRADRTRRGLCPTCGDSRGRDHAECCATCGDAVRRRRQGTGYCSHACQVADRTSQVGAAIQIAADLARRAG